MAQRKRRTGMPAVMKKEAMAREAKGMKQKITTKLPMMEGDKPKKPSMPHAAKPPKAPAARVQHMPKASPIKPIKSKAPPKPKRGRA